MHQLVSCFQKCEDVARDMLMVAHNVIICISIAIVTSYVDHNAALTSVNMPSLESTLS